MVLEGDAPAPAPASVVTLQDPSPPVSLEKLGVEELNLKSNEFYCYCYKVRRVGALFFFPCVGGRKKKHCTKSQPSALNPNAQVLPCAKRFTHDWSSCLFAHKVRQAGRMRGGGGGGGGEKKKGGGGQNAKGARPGACVNNRRWAVRHHHIVCMLLLRRTPPSLTTHALKTRT